MWISKEESGIVTSTLKPKMDKTRQAHESLLDEAITLQVLLLCAQRLSTTQSSIVKSPAYPL